MIVYNFPLIPKNYSSRVVLSLLEGEIREDPKNPKQPDNPDSPTPEFPPNVPEDPTPQPPTHPPLRAA
jgi:hypothetical protein